MTATEQLEKDRQGLAAAEDRLRKLQGEQARHASNPAAYANWKSECDAAQSEIDRQRLVVEQRQQDVQAEALEALQVEKSSQAIVNDKLATEMRADGPELLRRFGSLVSRIAAAEAATAQINKRLPDDEERLLGPDFLARHLRMQPEQILKEVDVELWVRADNGEILQDQRSVRATSKNEGVMGSWQTPCARRTFKEVVYYPDLYPMRTEPFLQALRLPFFDGAGFAWNGDAATNPANIQKMLDGGANAPKPAERQKQTRFVAIGPWEPPAELLSRHGQSGKRTGLERES